MPTVSGNPTLLADFVTTVAQPRVLAEDERSALSTYNATVAAGCPGRAVSCPALWQLWTTLDNMRINQEWLATIKDTLVAADTGNDGTATVDATVVLSALADKGLGEGPPLPTEFTATTRQIQPPTSGMVDDPINASNGNMVHHDLDLAFPAIAGALSITRTWNSLLADVRGAFGFGWTSVLDSRLDVADDGVVATMAEGNVIGFIPWRDSWVAPGVPHLSLTEPARDDPDGTWVLHADHLRRFRFDATGRLVGWDVGVAKVVVERDELDRITRLDELVTARSLAVEWDADLITQLRSDDGRSVRYERDRDGVITRVTSDAGSVTYVWEGELLLSVLDADGVAPFVNEYDADRRVVRQTSPFGRVSTYEYRDDGMTVFSDAAGVVQAMHHDRFGNLTGIVDVDGSAMRLAYNQRRQVVFVEERDGARWHYRYDGDDQIERTDPDGLSQTQIWDDRHRVIEARDRAGNVTRMEYDTAHVAPSRVIQPNGGVIHQRLDDRGLPTEIVDADGVVTRFEWDSDGQLVATYDAAGGVTAFDYDAHGYLRGIVPATGAPTIMDIAPGGRVLRTTCGESTWEYEYTPAGRIRAGVEPGGLPWSATFGPHGAMASVTDGTGATVGFTYDSNGNVTVTTAPDGAEYRRVYDEVGRPVADIEPTGATTAKAYDTRGRLVEVTDPRGHTWRRTLDVLGRTASSTAPDGAVTRWTYDPNGYPTEVLAPDGRVWRTEYDHEGRPTAVVEPGGGRAVIEYTAAGRIRSRTSPAGRTESFEYDPAGRLAGIVGTDGLRRETHRDARGRITGVTERDVDGEIVRHLDYAWDDAYRVTGVSETGIGIDGTSAATIRRDAGGRVIEALDATGVRTRYDWDARGLLAAATDPAGLVTTYDYDIRGRLSGIHTPGDRMTTVAYGSDGRRTSVTDPAGAVTRLLRDAAGVVTGQRFGDGSGWDRTLDAMDRETSRTATDGTVTGEFSYDHAGRLASAIAPDSGVTVGFLWDDNDRLEEVAGPDGTRRIERDADGWVTATIDPDGVRTDYRRDAGGRLLGVDPGSLGGGAGGPASDASEPRRDLAGRLTIGRDGTVYRYDDSARIAEIAPPDQAATTFEYGDEGLLVREHGPHGARSFVYDTGGRVVEVVTDDGTTSIGYDECGRRDRESHPDGSRTAYRWDAVGRLVRIERLDVDGDPIGAVDIGYDALDRAVLVDGRVVAYHPLSGLPLVEPGSPDDGPLGGVAAGDVFVVGARVLDPLTHQFLSADPLFPVPGTNGAASTYTYAWHDPINWVDPTGMRPISLEEFAAYQSQNDKGTFEKAWDAVKEDPWGTLAMVGVTAVGVGLCFVPGGQVVGAGILIGVATGAGVGLATGTFNPRVVALSGAMGAIPGGSTIRGAAAIGAVSGAGETVAGSYLNGEGFPSGEQLLVGTVTGGTIAGGGQAVRNLIPNGSTAATVHAPEAPPRPATPPGDGPVTFRPPPAATADEIAQVRAYVDGSNEALRNGQLSPTGRVSTAGELRAEASAAAAAERARAAAAGTPYQGHAGHVPDTTWTGTPQPPSWLDLDPRVNTSLGGQAAHYAEGYRPTEFRFEARE